MKTEEKPDGAELIIGLLQDIKQTSKRTFHWIRATSIIIMIILFVVALSPVVFPFIVSLFARP